MIKFFKQLFCDHHWEFVGRKFLRIHKIRHRDNSIAKAYENKYVCTLCEKIKFDESILTSFYRKEVFDNSWDF